MNSMKMLALSSIVALAAACTTTDHVTGTGRTIGSDPTTSYEAPATLTRAQFVDDRRFVTTWDAWDANRDRRIDRTEFATGTFDRLDINRDGWISRAELDTVSTAYPGFTNYEAWDTDRDMRISRNEYTVGVTGMSGPFGMWDTNRDMYLSQDELSTGTFGVWDTNRNGVIEVHEMRTTDPFFRY